MRWFARQSSLWSNDKAFGAIGAFDDFRHQIVYRIDGADLKHRSGIGAIGEQFAQERKLSDQSGRHQDTTVASVQQQAECIDQDVTLP